MIENVVTMKITGMSRGSVTYRNRAHVPAPSIVALSISSSGIVCSPARIVMPKNGSPRHVLTRITDTMARVGLPSHDGPWFCLTRSKNISSRLNIPMPGSKIHCQATVLSTVGTMNRSEEHTSELQSRLHLVCRLLLEKKKKEYTDIQ